MGMADFPDLLTSLAGARVAVIGDVMLDRYVYGAVVRISPEAPIPVLDIDKEKTMAGGAGNVARNIAALGAKAHLVALIGDDALGGEIATQLSAEEQVECDFVTAAGRETSVKTRYVAAGQQLLRTDRDDHQAVEAATAEVLSAAAMKAVNAADAVVLSDYAKGVLSPALIAAVIEAAARTSTPVIADPKGADFSRYAGVGVLTPNRAELTAATGMAADDDDQTAEAARTLIAEHDFGAVLATRGAAGMSLVSAAEPVRHISAQAREVFDVSGAGDTVVAALAAGLAAGADLTVAAELANAAAGVVVGKVGTAVVYADDIAAAYQAGMLRDAKTKVAMLARAADQVTGWQRAGKKIVFTNGCFDLIHPGHVVLLSAARAQGDRLVVGLNSDQSVRALKGSDRPVQNEAARAAVLASFAAVDLVVIFAEETPLTLIEALKPDVLVKGADYSEAEVVGAKAVKSWGGRVVLADIVEGYSTTETISKLNGGG